MSEDPAGAATGQHGSGPLGLGEPWPELATDGARPPERADLEAAFVTALRATGSLMTLITQATAERIGINGTDLNCLNILSFRGEMTAGELARATGLTTASITGVVDRLEQAGFVRRERDAVDRRRVVIHLSLPKAAGTVAPVFGPMIASVHKLADRYTDDELRLIVEFYGHMEKIFRDHLLRLREQTPSS